MGYGSLFTFALLVLRFNGVFTQDVFIALLGSHLAAS